MSDEARRRSFGLGIVGHLVAMGCILLPFAWMLVMLVFAPGAPTQTELNAQAARARADLVGRIGEQVRRAREMSESALARTAGVTGRSALFSRLAADEPAGDAGIVLEDRFGRALAWTGRPHDPGLPPPLEGASVIEGPHGVDLLFRLSIPATQAVDGDVAPVSAVARVPLDASPAAGPGAVVTPASLVRASHQVESVRITPPRVETTDGELVTWDIDTPLARVVVTPATAGAEPIDSGGLPIGLFIALAPLAGGLYLIWTVDARRSPGSALLATGIGLVVLFVFVLQSETTTRHFGEGALAPFGATAYSGDLGGDPLHVLLLGLFVCAAASALGRAAETIAGERLRGVAGLALALVVALGGHLALDHAIRDVVANSTLVLFPADRVLPDVAALLLIGGVLLLAGGLVVFLAHVLRCAGVTDDGSRAFALCVATGAVAAPWALAGDVASTLPCVVAFSLATAIATLRRGSPVRSAVVPLLLAVALFGPLETRLDESERDRVVAHADTSASLPRDTALQRVDSAVERILASDALAAALRERFLAPGLATRLWEESRLEELAAPAGVLLRPALGYGPEQNSGAGLPPTDWLPEPAAVGAGTDEEPGTRLASLEGRGAGRDGRWARATVPLRVDDLALGTLEVVLAWRRPTLAALEGLDVLTDGDAKPTRGAPDVTLHRYDVQGALVEGAAVSGSSGALLTPGRIRRVIDSGAPVWLPPGPGHAERGLLVRPVERDDGRRGADVFAYATRGSVGRLLAGTQAALLGALFAGLALLVDAGSWLARLRERLSHQLVLLLVALAAVPLLVLAVVSHRLILDRAESDFEAGLRQAAALAEVAVRQQLPDGTDAPDDEVLRRLAYARGHHLGVYGGGDRATLQAVSEPALARPDVLPARLPGSVFRAAVLLERPFVRQRSQPSGRNLDVGFAPLRAADGAVIGAIAVPYPQARRTRDRELAGATLTVLGFSLAALILAALVGTWLARRLVAPLQSLTAGAERVARGELGEPVPPAGRGELGKVIEAFNRMIEDLESSQQKLVTAEKESAWRDMARQVAHEVKNPLTPMRLAAQHLKRARDDEAEDFDRILDRAVDVIVRQTEKLQRIVTDFRDFARLPQVKRVPVDVGRLLRGAADLYAHVPGVATVVEIDDDVPPVVANPEEFERVLVNLLGNAVEAFDGGGGKLIATLAAVPGDRVSLRIEDDGPGIPDEALPRLFEPSFSTKSGGTGLGLAICKRAIDDLGGSIEIASPPGGGTVVQIVLPAHREDA